MARINIVMATATDGTKLDQQQVIALGIAKNFLESKEHLAFYDLKAEYYYVRSSPRLTERRLTYLQAVETCRAWFSLESSYRYAVWLSKVICPAESNRSPRERSHLREVLLLWPSATDLFSENDFSSIESLKKAYRRAAFICHPDHGGRHEMMIELNAIFHFTHDRIVHSFAVENGLVSEGSPTLITPFVEIMHGNTVEYVDSKGAVKPNKRLFGNPMYRDFMVAIFWLDMLDDDWDLPAMANVLARIDLFGVLAECQDRSVIGPFSEMVDSFFRKCRGLGREDIIRTLLGTLAAEPSIFSADFLRNAGATFLSNRRLKGIYLRSHNPVARKNASQLTSDPELRTRYGKFVRKNSVEASNLTGIGFLRLPLDLPRGAKPSDMKHVHFPANIWETDTPRKAYSSAQHWEYHEAFYRSYNIDLIKKYAWARGFYLVRNLVFSKLPYRDILAEMSYLATICPERLKHFQDISKKLQELTDGEIESQIKLLAPLYRSGAVGADLQDSSSLLLAEKSTLRRFADDPESIRETPSIAEHLSSLESFLSSVNDSRLDKGLPNETQLAFKTRRRSAYFEACIQAAERNHILVVSLPLHAIVNELSLLLIKGGNTRQASQCIKRFLDLLDASKHEIIAPKTRLLRKRLGKMLDQDRSLACA